MKDLIKKAKLGEYGRQLEELSAQEVFDISVGHLIAQGEQSVDAEGGCVYDGGGVCCAAAPFIKKYNKHFDVAGGVKWSSIGQDSIHTRLLSDLQDLHDMVAHWDEDGFVGFERARKIANFYNLEYKFKGVER